MTAATVATVAVATVATVAKGAANDAPQKPAAKCLPPLRKFDGMRRLGRPIAFCAAASLAAQVHARSLERPGGRPILFFGDLDGTLLGQDTALLAFRDYWQRIEVFGTLHAPVHALMPLSFVLVAVGADWIGSMLQHGRVLLL